MLQLGGLAIARSLNNFWLQPVSQPKMGVHGMGCKWEVWGCRSLERREFKGHREVGAAGQGR